MGSQGEEGDRRVRQGDVRVEANDGGRVMELRAPEVGLHDASRRGPARLTQVQSGLQNCKVIGL